MGKQQQQPQSPEVVEVKPKKSTSSKRKKSSSAVPKASLLSYIIIPKSSKSKKATVSDNNGEQKEDTDEGDAVRLKRLCPMQLVSEEDLGPDVDVNTIPTAYPVKELLHKGKRPAPEALEDVDPFFLTPAQKKERDAVVRRKKQKQVEAERMKRIATLNAGRKVHPFLQPRKNSGANSMEKRGIDGKRGTGTNSNSSSSGKYIKPKLVPAPFPRDVHVDVEYTNRHATVSLPPSMRPSDENNEPEETKDLTVMTKEWQSIYPVSVMLGDGDALGESKDFAIEVDADEPVIDLSTSPARVGAVGSSSDSSLMGTSSNLSGSPAIDSVAIDACLQRHGTLLEKLRGVVSGRGFSPSIVELQQLWRAKLEARAHAPSVSMPWVDMFAPGTSEHVTGNAHSVNSLKAWLSKWLSKRQDEAERLRRKQERVEAGYSSDEEEEDASEELPAGFILQGPSGSGKTAAIRVCANQVGYNMLEINSGMQRSGKDIMALCAEATQSHFLLRTTSGSTSSSVVVFEEVDHLFEENGDVGFFSAVKQLLRNTKRPMLFTCNDVPDELAALKLPVLQFWEPLEEEILCHTLLVVMACVGVPDDPNEALRFCFNLHTQLRIVIRLCSTDLRRTLNTLQVLLPHLSIDQVLAGDCVSKNPGFVHRHVVSLLHGMAEADHYDSLQDLLHFQGVQDSRSPKATATDFPQTHNDAMAGSEADLDISVAASSSRCDLSYHTTAASDALASPPSSLFSTHFPHIVWNSYLHRVGLSSSQLSQTVNDTFHACLFDVSGSTASVRTPCGHTVEVDAADGDEDAKQPCSTAASEGGVVSTPLGSTASLPHLPDWIDMANSVEPTAVRELQDMGVELLEELAYSADVVSSMDIVEHRFHSKQHNPDACVCESVALTMGAFGEGPLWTHTVEGTCDCFEDVCDPSPEISRAMGGLLASRKGDMAGSVVSLRSDCDSRNEMEVEGDGNEEMHTDSNRGRSLNDALVHLASLAPAPLHRTLFPLGLAEDGDCTLVFSDASDYVLSVFHNRFTSFVRSMREWRPKGAPFLMNTTALLDITAGIREINRSEQTRKSAGGFSSGGGRRTRSNRFTHYLRDMEGLLHSHSLFLDGTRLTWRDP